ncbi:MAG: pilus assembly protein N-terminal domain-containing protein, partial [Armatimonadota bacterium]
MSDNRKESTRLDLLGALLLCSLTLTLAAAWAAPTSAVKSTRNLVLPEGRGTLLHFNRMRRVEIVIPELVDVVVASLNDLSVLGKKAGATTIYVWDKQGLHQLEVTVTADSPAARLIRDLKGALGTKLTYTMAGDKTVLIEGSLPAAEAARARSVLTAAAKGEVQIVDLLVAEGETASAAMATADALRKVLGDQLQYVVWNESTVLVQGAVPDQVQLDRAKKLLAAASTKGVNVVDLIEINPAAGTAPVEEIARAVGDRFRVWQIQGNTVGVDGTVGTQAELADLSRILDSFATQARIVNLVRVNEPKADINQTAALLQRVAGNGITVRPADGRSLLVEGVLATDDALTKVRELIARIPTTFPMVDLLHVGLPDKRQIVCHVRVVDITKGTLSRLGVNWGQLSIADSTVSFVDQPWLVSTLPSGLATGGANGILNALNIGAQLETLAQNNQARILSQPNLMVDDGGKATILVGGEIPIPTAQTNGAVSVEWKAYGVKLEIAPTILESGNRINVNVVPEVSSLDPGNSVTIGGIVLPALRSRKASTTVTMTNGDTLIIGGLLQNDESKAIRKIPLLGDLPIIGNLFRRKEFQTGQSELVIMVTPEIIERIP